MNRIRRAELVSLGLIGLLAVSSITLIAQTVTFKKTKEEYQVGDKRRIREVALIFTDETMRVTSRNGNALYAEIPIASVTELVYERTKHPRIKTAIFVTPWALLSKGKKHWFTVKYKEGEQSKFLLFQLDKKEYQQVIAMAEVKTGLKAERVID